MQRYESQNGEPENMYGSCICSKYIYCKRNL